MSGVDVPPDKMVLHSCDNPCCVNPKHLRVGDAFDNMADMRERDRSMFGARNVNAKLDDDKVRSICDALRRGERMRTISARFGVDLTAIAAIRQGKTWTRVTGGRVDAPSIPDGWMSLPAAAAELGSCPSTILNWCASGKLECRRDITIKKLRVLIRRTW